jgi:hypothetical protein
MYRATSNHLGSIRGISDEELVHVAGGMIKLPRERPMPLPQEPAGPGVGYFLPEMEMDTGLIFLPS